MFEPFLTTFAEARRPTSGEWRRTRQSGWVELLGEHGGSTFDRGLYRLHDPATSELANTAVAEAHPELVGHVSCFGYDWLGRQFAIDSRAPETESVRMIEPGTGEVLVLPASFTTFHNSLLLTHRDAALASNFFDRWVASNPGGLPLRSDRCVGYRVPLFLGGRDELDNLEETDLWVYLDLSAQLLAGSRGRQGTPIIGVTIE